MLGSGTENLGSYNHRHRCLGGFYTFETRPETYLLPACTVPVITCLLLPHSLDSEMITEALFSFFILGFLSFSLCAAGNQSAWLLISVNTISQEGRASQSEPPGADWAANGSEEN